MTNSLCSVHIKRNLLDKFASSSLSKVLLGDQFLSLVHELDEFEFTRKWVELDTEVRDYLDGSDLTADRWANCKFKGISGSHTTNNAGPS